MFINPAKQNKNTMPVIHNTRIFHVDEDLSTPNLRLPSFTFVNEEGKKNEKKGSLKVQRN
jgi:hypothetical protein